MSMSKTNEEKLAIPTSKVANNDHLAHSSATTRLFLRKTLNIRDVLSLIVITVLRLVRKTLSAIKASMSTLIKEKGDILPSYIASSSNLLCKFFCSTYTYFVTRDNGIVEFLMDSCRRNMRTEKTDTKKKMKKVTKV